MTALAERVAHRPRSWCQGTGGHGSLPPAWLDFDAGASKPSQGVARGTGRAQETVLAEHKLLPYEVMMSLGCDSQQDPEPWPFQQ